MGMILNKPTLLIGIFLLIGALVSGCRRVENTGRSKTIPPPQIFTTETGIEMIEISEIP